MLNPNTLRAVREMYLVARRNGLPPPRAQYHAARKARELIGPGDLVRKYVNVVIDEMGES